MSVLVYNITSIGNYTTYEGYKKLWIAGLESRNVSSFDNILVLGVF